jgi:hypothetical protein
MNSELINALKRELEQLEAEFSLDPRYCKIEHIRRLLSYYEAEANDAPGSCGLPSLGPTSAPARPATGMANANSKLARVRRHIAEFLAERRSASRREILDYLIERNVMGQEGNPMASLASYLSVSPQFCKAGSGYWSLSTEVSAAARPQRDAESQPSTGTLPSCE